jgi:hypothetical protein
MYPDPHEGGGNEIGSMEKGLKWERRTDDGKARSLIWIHTWQ